jgi:hypothetical protein
MSKADTVAFEYAKEKGTLGLDYNQIYDAVKYGYQQAEKNLKLSWEDLKMLDDISDDVYAECDVEMFDEKEYYQEMLKRFKERKG